MHPAITTAALLCRSETNSVENVSEGERQGTSEHRFLQYGDAAITPAISVMSALEGLNIIAPHLERYLLPATVVILVALFAVQQQGTARIGRLWGPVMLIWFVIIALLGLWGITQHPAVLWALDPTVGLRYLFAGGGITTLLVVGGVFLCVSPERRRCMPIWVILAE